MQNNKLTIKDLSVGYLQLVISKGINLEFTEGDFVGLIGNNGSGKTTLLKTIAGLINPLKGEINIDANNINSLNAFQRFEQISYMPTERPQASFLTVNDIFETSLRYLYKDEQIRLNLDNLCERFNCTELRKKMFVTLSDGQKQKVLLITVLARNSSIVLLDEALVYLDYETKIKALETLKDLCLNHKKIVILISHELDLLNKYVDKTIQFPINDI